MTRYTCRDEYRLSLRGALGAAGLLWLILRAIIGFVGPPHLTAMDMIAGVLILMSLDRIVEVPVFLISGVATSIVAPILVLGHIKRRGETDD